jgi:hypothetical protein
MNLFVRHYMRLQHNREKDEGFEEKRTKVVSTCNIDLLVCNWGRISYNLMIRTDHVCSYFFLLPTHGIDESSAVCELVGRGAC